MTVQADAAGGWAGEKERSSLWVLRLMRWLIHFNRGVRVRTPDKPGRPLEPTNPVWAAEDHEVSRARRKQTHGDHADDLVDRILEARGVGDAQSGGE